MRKTDVAKAEDEKRMSAREAGEANHGQARSATERLLEAADPRPQTAESAHGQTMSTAERQRATKPMISGKHTARRYEIREATQIFLTSQWEPGTVCIGFAEGGPGRKSWMARHSGSVGPDGINEESAKECLLQVCRDRFAGGYRPHWKVFDVSDPDDPRCIGP